MVARRAHNPKVVGSNPASATTKVLIIPVIKAFFFCIKPTTEGSRRHRLQPPPVADEGQQGMAQRSKKSSKRTARRFFRAPQEDVGSNPASATTRIPNHPSG